MSQEKSNANKAETRKKILLGVLFALLIGVLYYQLFYESESPQSGKPTTVTTSGSPKATTSPTPRPLKAGEQPEHLVTQPLVFAWFGRQISSEGTGRNIFAYPTPTPVPPPPPAPPVPTPPPPPIQLLSIQPQGIIGRTGDFPLTIFVDKIPQDVQAFLNGRAYPAEVVSTTQLKIQVPGEVINVAGNVGIMVRSQSDAKLYSNQLSLNVAEPPAPPYKYIGIVVSRTTSTAVLKSQADDEILNVTKGQKIGGHWKVISITPQKIEIEDTNIKIFHTINFTNENGS